MSLNSHTAAKQTAKTPRPAVWNPPVDIYETAEAIVVQVDLPEVNTKDIQISVHGKSLTISGRRERQGEPGGEQYYQFERDYGSFTRILLLPSIVDPNRIQPDYTEGVLKLTLPKTPIEESTDSAVKSEL